MVLGIGEGSLDIALGKYSYRPGETINGTVQLRLNSPKQARALRIDFYGEIRQYTGKSTSVRRINQFTQQASGERIYNNGESIPFTLIVPAVSSNTLPAGMPSFLSGLMAAFQPKPTWYVHASLDAPMALDINKRVQIVLIDAQGKPL
ncbi:Uncharacterised protein [uncultured archaeon]|nr:Uncharacterised protein [uncultured archaeon]